MELSFSNLSYKVKDKLILNELSGLVSAGSTHYILGSSGAGKTSLLSALAG
jgi:ABC-type multidrug transport system ATPase subunit